MFVLWFILSVLLDGFQTYAVSTKKNIGYLVNENANSLVVGEMI